jgi:hypothetical protein
MVCECHLYILKPFNEYEYNTNDLFIFIERLHGAVGFVNSIPTPMAPFR